ncbi:MAG: hypothetical protein ACI311_00555 [Bacilli bacterium]
MQEMELEMDVNNFHQSFENLKKILQEQAFQKNRQGIYLIFNDKPNEGMVSQIIDCFFCFKSAYLLGVKVKKDKKMEIINDNIHNGQVIINRKPMVIMGSLNSGGCIKSYNDVCIDGDAYGNIELMGSSNVFLKNAIGVTIHLENGLSRQVSGRNILINNDILEDMIWQE